jgi:hypothetical protein
MSDPRLEEFIKSDIFKEQITSLLVPYTTKIIEECIRQHSETTKHIVADTVKTVFLEMGLNISRETDEIKKDFSHMRQARQGCEAIKSNAIKTILTVTIPTVLYFVGNAIIEKLQIVIK